MNLPENELEWSLLTVVTWVHDAQYLRTLLESSEIECFIPDELTGLINPMLTAMSIRILVRKGDLKAAKEVLKDYELVQRDNNALNVNEGNNAIAIQSSQPDEQPCPNCLNKEALDYRRKLKNLFLFIIGILNIVPIKRSSSRSTCQHCGFRY